MAGDITYHHVVKHWRPELAVLSFIVSFLGAYTTTQLCIQTGGTRQTGRALFWISLAAVCFGGTGIFCMHFIAMLAVELDVPVHYAAGETMFTAFIAIFGMFFALVLNVDPPERSTAGTMSWLWHQYIDVLSRTFWSRCWRRDTRGRISLPYNRIDADLRTHTDDSEMSQQLEEQSSTVDSDSMYRDFDLREVRQAAGNRAVDNMGSVRGFLVALSNDCTPKILMSGALLGLNVFAMHYLGMRAMKFEGRIRYNRFLVLLSFLEAWLASVVALISMPVETDTRRQLTFSIVASIAVSGLHYIGMFATTFETTLVPPFEKHLLNYTLAASCAGIAITTCFVSYAFLAHAVSDHRSRLQGYIQTRKELWKGRISCH